MPWTTYLACFFAGAFLANAVPHFVYGISGDRFPTPFAKPPGKGLSSSTVNMVWALVNLAIGAWLCRAGDLMAGDWAGLLLAFAGVAVIGLWLSVQFSKKAAA